MYIPYYDIFFLIRTIWELFISCQTPVGKENTPRSTKLTAKVLIAKDTGCEQDHLKSAIGLKGKQWTGAPIYTTTNRNKSWQQVTTYID